MGYLLTDQCVRPPVPLKEKSLVSHPLIFTPIKKLL